MRQILVKESPFLGGLSGDRIEFTAKNFKAVSIEPKLQLLRCNFSAEVVSGGALNLKFDLSRAIAEKGAVLHGAYWESDEITLAISSLGGSISLDKDDVLVVGYLYEAVRYRQIKLDPTAPKKSRKARK